MTLQLESTLIRTTDGLLAWRRPSGRLVPFTVSGGADDDGSASGGDPTSGSDQGTTGSDGPQFTQAQVNDIAAREKNEGKRAVQREIAEQLGMTVEEAKAFIEKAKADELERMSEADRKLAEADERERQAQKALAEAAEARREARVQANLTRAGVPVEQVEMVARLIDPSIESDEDIATAVASIKEQLPQMFQPKGSPGAGGYTPPKAPPGSGGAKKDAAAAGRERALARLGKTTT